MSKVSIVWFTELAVVFSTMCFMTNMYETLKNKVTINMEPMVPIRSSRLSDIYRLFFITYYYNTTDKFFKARNGALALCGIAQYN